MAERVLSVLRETGRTPEALLYARVDLLRDAAGAPFVLELELAEPSLFLGFAAGAAERFAQQIAAAVRRG